MRQIYGQIYNLSEKLAFECDMSFRDPTTNLHQQNPYVTSGIIFETIPVSSIRKVLLDFLLYQLSIVYYLV